MEMACIIDDILVAYRARNVLGILICERICFYALNTLQKWITRRGTRLRKDLISHSYVNFVSHNFLLRCVTFVIMNSVITLHLIFLDKLPCC